jgi:hypothetical protein
MKKIGFLSFGHWSDHPSYGTRTAGDTLLQGQAWQPGTGSSPKKRKNEFPLDNTVVSFL